MFKGLKYFFFRGTFLLFFLTCVNAVLFSEINDTLNLKQAEQSKSQIEKRLDYLTTTGLAFQKSGAPDSALIMYRAGVKLSSSDTKYYSWLSNFYRMIGGLYISHSNYVDGIIYYEKSLEASEKFGDKEQYMQHMAEIGSAYMSAGEYEKALDCYLTARDYGYQYNKSSILTRSLNSLGDLSRLTGDYDAAIRYHEEALAVFFKAEGHKFEYWACTSLGKNYVLKGDCEKAKEYFNIVLDPSRSDLHPSLAAQAYLNMAICERNSGNSKGAITYGLLAFEQSIILPEISLQSIISEKLAIFYEEAGAHREALNYYKNFKLLSDSLGNAAQVKKLSELIFNQKEEKLLDAAKLNDQLLETEKENRASEGKIFRNILIAAGIMLLITVFYLFFIFKSLQKNRKQNKIIEAQKEDIICSIRYAKRIQTAILPQDGDLSEALPENFVLYKPKDIVAGDFYWLEKLNGIVLFAVADCTGHGVPGALVSVICNNGLSRAVHEHGLSDPGKILEKVREIVIAQFEKSAADVQDGMDIALCSVSGNKLCFSGANNPLWIFRKGQFTEVTGNKQPIGKYIHSNRFETHTFLLEKGDTIYLASDGYADQFGGTADTTNGNSSRSKKFKKSNLINLLHSVQSLSMAEQSTKIDTVFETWKNENEQVDDVCIMGVRF